MKEIAKEVKSDSFILMTSGNEIRNNCLENIINNLNRDREHITSKINKR